MTRAIRRALSWGGAALLLMLIDVPAVSSTFLAMELPELVAESDFVVRGEVLKTRSFWDPQHRVILTEAQVRVDERLKGPAEAGQSLTVLTFGGKVDDYEIVAHGFPTFAAGERVLLFLQRHSDRSLRVTGYELGHYDLVERSGQAVAVPTVTPGTSLVLPDGREVEGPAARPMADLRKEIRELATQTPSRP